MRSWVHVSNEKNTQTYLGVVRTLKSEILYGRGARNVLKILCAEKQYLFVTVCSSARWVKPAEPTLSIPTLLMGTLPRDADMYCKARNLFFC